MITQIVLIDRKSIIIIFVVVSIMYFEWGIC